MIKQSSPAQQVRTTIQSLSRDTGGHDVDAIMVFIKRMKENSLIRTQIIELAGNSIISNIEKTRKVEDLEKEKIILNIKNLFRIFEMLSTPYDAMYNMMEEMLIRRSFFNLLLERCETLKTLDNTK